MKTNNYFRLRRVVALVTASLALGGLFGTAFGQSTPMYRMPTLGSGGGVPSQAILYPSFPTATNWTLSWYGTLGWYTVLAGATPTTITNPVGSVLATTYASQTSVPIPITTNNYAFATLYQYNSYAGSTACGGCHGDHYTPYLATEHATAFNALGANQTNTSCVVCHTVGDNQPTGFSLPLTSSNAYLTGVGCESCHGPAAWHKSSDHTQVLPVLSIDPAICGSCHQGHNPQYGEYTNSIHNQVNDTINYGVEGGYYVPNTIVVSNVTLYGYYVVTNASGQAVSTNAVAGIFNSSYVPGSAVDPGQSRQASCGICHSGAARMAMLRDYANRQIGVTNALVFPTATDAGSWGPTCAVCHDPHANTPYVEGWVLQTNVVAGVTTVSTVPLMEGLFQLRNPTDSTNYYTMATTTDERFDSFGNPYYMNTCFASLYNTNINICGQCHNTRGARWDGESYGLIYNTNGETIPVISAAYTNVVTAVTNAYGGISGYLTNEVYTGNTITNYLATNVVSATVGLIPTSISFSREPHESPQYNMLIGIIQPDYLNVNAQGVATNYTSGSAHSGVGPSTSSHFNTNQCATCHMPVYSSPTNYSGHMFVLQTNGCYICHGSGPPSWQLGIAGSEQTTTSNGIYNVVAMLNKWATNNAPALFGSRYNNYLQNAWEYTSPGSLGSTVTTKGPSASDQLLLPAAILQARFDIYMVYNDQSFGVHNPGYATLLINDASNKVVGVMAAAGTNGSAYFSAGNQTNGYAPDTVYFTSYGGGITNYSWNFGDGIGTSILANPVYTYATNGSFTVSLQTIANGVTTNYTRTNYINVSQLPAVSFTASATGVAPGGAVTFTSTSLNTASVTNWIWTVMTGVTITNNGSPVTFTYTNAGNYNVSLKANTPAGGITTTYTNFVSVVAPPTAGFTATPSSGPAPLAVVLNNTSANATGYLWTIYLSSSSVWTSTATNLVFTFTNVPSAGYPVVTLQASNTGGSSTATNSSITVTGGTANAATFITSYGSTNVYAGIPFTFQCLGSGVTNYYWTFGDGGWSTAASPSYTYNTVDTNYTVTLTARNASGQFIYSRKVYVYQQPTLGFITSPSAVYTNANVSFTNLSTATQDVQSWVWSFQSGVSVTNGASVVSTTYATPGTNTVSLQAITPVGSTTAVSNNYVTVFNQPLASFIPSALTITNGTGTNATINFTNTSVNASSYLWTFNLSSTSTWTSTSATSPLKFVFTNAAPAGYPIITLQAINPAGSTTATNSSITVN